jgi:hypothetical protein
MDFLPDTESVPRSFPFHSSGTASPWIFVLVYKVSLQAGQYRTHVWAPFSLAQLAEAHEAQDSGSLDDKTLIDLR